MTANRRQLLSFMSGVMASSVMAPAFAQNADGWPEKPIRLIVPMSAGGAADIWARILVPSLGEA